MRIVAHRWTAGAAASLLLWSVSAPTAQSQLRFTGADGTDEVAAVRQRSPGDTGQQSLQTNPLRRIDFQQGVPSQLLPSPEQEANPSPEGPLSPTAPAPTAPAEAGGDSSPPADSQLLTTPGDGVFEQVDQQRLPIFYSTNDWFRRGIWYGQSDVVALLRTGTTDITLAVDQTDNFTLDRPMLTTKDADPTYELGTRVTVGKFLGQDVVNRDYTLEFSFLGLFDYSDSATLVAAVPGNLQTVIAPGVDFVFGNGADGPPFGGFSNATSQTFSWSSDFNNYEVNLRILSRPRRDRLALQPNGDWVRYGSSSRLKSFLLGARYTSLHEKAIYRSEFLNPANSGLYEVRTDNDMFGVQAGAELIENYNDWSWGLRTKFGMMYNVADRSSLLDILDNNAPTTRSQRDEKDNLAAVIEAGLLATYQIRTNLIARAAYDVIYIQGVGVAPENMELGGAFRGFEVTGDALYHGASLGIEMLW